MSEERARYGWESDFPEFKSAEPSVVRDRLRSFIVDASPEQIAAWQDSIPALQREVDEVLVRDALAKQYSAILEYELPLESRRPDVLLLVGAGVMVLELKGKQVASQADIDQAAAYARDLRCYHRACFDRTIVPVVVPTRARGYVQQVSGVHIAGPDALDDLVAELTTRTPGPPIERRDFLSENAYRPLPSLVEAARELFHSGELRTIHRARAATDPAVRTVRDIIYRAAATNTRHLVLLTGVPGAGKTLVGLRTVHAHYLDDLAVARPDGKPTAPAVFLSGNGPLVQVLQYELRQAGGGGKAFVRDVKNYVKRHSSARRPVPSEHVLVFDEAQRAFDAEQVRETHGDDADHKSEPEHFIEFAERIPQWCVVVGLIGSGQEIHVGEEGGLIQWQWAVERATDPKKWTVHAPPSVADVFTTTTVPVDFQPTLSLDIELRFHFASRLHQFVADLLASTPAHALRPAAEALESEGFHLRLTRSLDTAKAYLRERYQDDRDARFGLIASSRDKDLQSFGIPNDYHSTQRVRVGPWYADSDTDSGYSCRRLESCMTEFGAQGLELDATLLAWGTDLVLTNGVWSNERAKKYQRGAKVRNPFQLRINAYRVLLTRGRDACVVFVPPISSMDETFNYLAAAGFRIVTSA